MTKRMRGRPLSPDGRLLTAMADLLIRKPHFSITAAARQVAPKEHSQESTEHRLRRKFRARELELMADARNKQSAEADRTVSRFASRIVHDVGEIARNVAGLHEYYSPQVSAFAAVAQEAVKLQELLRPASYISDLVYGRQRAEIGAIAQAVKEEARARALFEPHLGIAETVAREVALAQRLHAPPRSAVDDAVQAAILAVHRAY